MEKFAELKGLTLVRRAFRLEFFPRKSTGVPRLTAFQRLVGRFKTVAATRPCVPSRRHPTTAGEVEQVKDFFQKNTSFGKFQQKSWKNYWFQQDGAPCHTSATVIDFLRSKFNDRIISRGSAHHWPACSPDLSCLDFSFWSLALDRVVESEPKTIQELKKVVQDFVTGISKKQLRKMTQHTRTAQHGGAVRGGGRWLLRAPPLGDRRGTR